MLTGSFKTHKHHVYKAGKVEVLKAAAIYGANGAGKSNLVKAIGYLQELVREGAINTSINSKKFKLDLACQDKPVRFEIEFFTNEKLYAYGLVIDHTAVLEEWLYEVGITKKDKLIFERTTDELGRPNLAFAKEYQKTQKQRLLTELMRDNLLKEGQLLLGKHEELKINEIRNAQSWIDSMVKVMYPDTSFFTELLLPLLSNDTELLSISDLGIDDFKTKKISIDSLADVSEALKEEINEALDSKQSVVRYVGDKLVEFVREGGRDVALKVVIIHKVGDNIPVEFDLTEESDGTRRVLDYIPLTAWYIAGGHTVFVDEIDRSIHPNLIKALIKNTLGKEDTKGQLIFTTHESNLLDLNIFRQDEIWFAEKERNTGATHFYSLSEFKPRYDLDIKKGYLNGRFGAIPFLGDLENLNWNQHVETE